MNLPGKIVLFDGVCNLCNSGVQFILKRDRKGLFYFASLQGEAGVQLSWQYHISHLAAHSFAVIDNGKAYTRSTAALRIVKALPAPWSLLYGFIVIPKFLRDAVYNFVARNRYKWFGKKESCWLPAKKWEHRFVDASPAWK